MYPAMGSPYATLPIGSPYATPPDDDGVVFDDDELMMTFSEDDDIDYNPPVPAWKAMEKGPALGEKGLSDLHGGYTKGGMGPDGTVLSIRHMGKETRGKDIQKNVKYAKRGLRIRYQVSMGARIKHLGGKWIGQNVDTQTYKTTYQDRYKSRGSDHPKKRPLGHATMRNAYAPWLFQTLIWVCVRDRKAGDIRFYTHVCKTDRFHHSSFVAGRGVVGAGEWYIVKGKLKVITGNSGHYRPDLSTLHGAVLQMTSALHRDTKVYMWDKTETEYVERPVQDFLQRPNGEGRYQVSEFAQM